MGSLTQYAYDVENQLIRVEGVGSRVDYRYDGLGRRIEKDVNGALTRYLYDQEDILQLYDGANTWKQTFFHGPGIDQPFAFIQSGFDPATTTPFHYLTADALGSIMSLLTSPDFRIRERYVYDSFGTPLIIGPGSDGVVDTADDVTLSCSAFGNPYLFTGREYDCESGLYYHRGRYRDPITGRFMQEDPLKGDDVHPQQQYLYAEGNPTNLIDPDGQTAIAPPVGVGAVCFTSPVGAILCAAGAVALAILAHQTSQAITKVAGPTFCPIEKAESAKDFPENPDEWVPPPGVKEETKTKEETGGKHRQWKDSSGKTVRRWDKGEPSAPGNRGKDHWHDPINRPGEHISPNR